MLGNIYPQVITFCIIETIMGVINNEVVVEDLDKLDWQEVFDSFMEGSKEASCESVNSFNEHWSLYEVTWVKNTIIAPIGPTKEIEEREEMPVELEEDVFIIEMVHKRIKCWMKMGGFIKLTVVQRANWNLLVRIHQIWSLKIP